MSWHPTHSNNEDVADGLDFILDESLAPSVQRALGNLRYRPAPKEFQIVLTQDRESIADRRLIPHPGAVIVILPAVIDIDLLAALTHALSLLCSNWRCIENSRILLNNDGRLTLLCGNRKTHYKLRKAGPPLIWVPKAETPARREAAALP
jgi:hypothetical protein